MFLFRNGPKVRNTDLCSPPDEHLFSSVVVSPWENDRQRDYLGGLWAAYSWPSWRLTLWPDRGPRPTLQTPSCGDTGVENQ